MASVRRVVKNWLPAGAGRPRAAARRRARHHRIAPADQHVGVVARRDVMVLVDAGLDLVKTES